MTRKDYEKIAAAIRAQVEQYGTSNIDKLAVGAIYGAIDKVAQAMAQDNPKFNRALFLSACGFPLELQR